MGRAAVAEAVQVALHRLDVDVLLTRLLQQRFVAVLTLGAGRYLNSPPQQIEAERQIRAARRPHMVKGTYRRRVLGHEYELVPGFCRDMRRKATFTFRVEILSLVPRIPARAPQDAYRLGHRHPRKRNHRNFEIDAEVLTDRIAVARCDAADGMGEHALLEGHDIVHAIDPSHLDIHAGELGRMPGSERWLRAERRSDLENALDSSGYSHLLVKLRRLGEIGTPAEVIQPEYFCAGL